jgi:hypothetical protein
VIELLGEAASLVINKGWPCENKAESNTSKAESGRAAKRQVDGGRDKRPENRFGESAIESRESSMTAVNNRFTRQPSSLYRLLLGRRETPVLFVCAKQVTCQSGFSKKSIAYRSKN